MGVPIHLAAAWPVLSPLLDEALDLPTLDRAAWLANLPQEHRKLRTALGALLANASPLNGDEAFECAPEATIGAWRLIEKIGEGGMAEVWIAERSDGLPARPVAIKLPRRGCGNQLFCERLARERDILDSLNHPNIARLLDAGAASNGQPYLVLEYVEGKRIDEYCRERSLPVATRLELFLQVARAIAVAHRSLVLHRDLKPSNILVTSEGEIRVLDFGIAKLLELGQTEETDLTLFAGRAFTLDYASPEQIAGRPLTVASDVYSLGIVLYELLTGVRPYSLNPKSAADLESQILEVQLPRPSEIAAGKEFQRALRGDLDRIILMAMGKLPRERYASVEAFAEDVQRYLQRRPVLAQRRPALVPRVDVSSPPLARVPRRYAAAGHPGGRFGAHHLAGTRRPRTCEASGGSQGNGYLDALRCACLSRSRQAGFGAGSAAADTTKTDGASQRRHQDPGSGPQHSGRESY